MDNGDYEEEEEDLVDVEYSCVFSKRKCFDRSVD